MARSVARRSLVALAKEDARQRCLAHEPGVRATPNAAAVTDSARVRHARWLVEWWERDLRVRCRNLGGALLTVMTDRLIVLFTYQPSRLIRTFVTGSSERLFSVYLQLAIASQQSL